MKIADKVIKKINEGKEEDLHLIIDQLVNDDMSDDDDMIDFLVEETGFDRAKIKKLIKTERPKFLKDMKLQMLPTGEIVKIIKKYL